jgi:hypothetical protein
MTITDGNGLPISLYVSSAAPHAITLVESMLAARFTDHVSERLKCFRPSRQRWATATKQIVTSGENSPCNYDWKATAQRPQSNNFHCWLCAIGA